MDGDRRTTIFEPRDSLATALKQDVKSPELITQVQWTGPTEAWSSGRRANEDPWARQVTRYLQRRSDAGILFSIPLQRTAARGE